MSVSGESKEGGVGFGLNKAEREEKMRSKPAEPSTRCLLKAIQRFVEATDVLRLGEISEAVGLLVVHCLGESAMEEDIVDV